MERAAGMIFDIQRFCLDDGPGIRSTVFLKGCPLRCQWCHNPEGLTREPALLYDERLCSRCGACAAACPRGCHSVTPEGGHRLERGRCIACGRCVQACPNRALELAGRRRTVAEVLDVVLRDQVFYRRSGGGVTVSGGEPLFQPDFLHSLLTELHRHGVHTCLETSGYATWTVLDRIRRETDLFLFDLKETDPDRHRQDTGVPLPPILDNLERLMDCGSRVILRCPLIPQHNARDGHYIAVAALANRLPGLAGIELEPYHSLGLAKWRRTGQNAPYHNPNGLPPEEGERAAEIIRAATAVPVTVH